MAAETIGHNAITGPATERPVGCLARIARLVVLLLAVVLTAGVLSQFFLAGLSVFDTPRHWPTHAALGSVLGLVAFFVWIPAAVGRVGWMPFAGVLLLPVLFIFQHVFPHLGQPALRALHPLNGALIFALSLWLARRTFPLMRRQPRQPARPV